MGMVCVCLMWARFMTHVSVGGPDTDCLWPDCGISLFVSPSNRVCYLSRVYLKCVLTECIVCGDFV